MLRLEQGRGRQIDHGLGREPRPSDDGGAEPERLTGEASLGESRGALELTRAAPAYDIEAMRTFSRQCPNVILTTRRDKADVILRIERDDPNPTTPFTKSNKIAVFNLNDELVYATKARLLSNASKDACRAIQNLSAPPRQIATPGTR